MVNHRNKITVLFFFSILLPSLSLAWGSTGHRAVGLIAENHLTLKARKAIKKITGDESLAQMSTWPDYIKSNPKHDFRKPWHYINIKDGGTYTKTATNSRGDVVISINEQIKTLKNKKSTKNQKAIALKFLVHLIGDIHQPLHVGRSKDRGGNSLKILFFKAETNLHRLWDENMIDHSKLSFTELTRFVDRPSQFHKKWLNTNAEDWANEAVRLRGIVYNFTESYIKPYSQEHLTMTPKLFNGKVPKVSWRYITRNWPVIKKQIHKAGRRLANTLNQIYQ